MVDRSSQWFAIYVKPRHEKVISCALRNKGYEEFTPTYQSRGRSHASELPLFPGYVFCRFDTSNRLPILSVPGVFFIVGVGRTPVPIADQEIANLQTTVQSGLALQPWPYVQVGERVQVQSGALSGVEGIVTRIKNADRLVVSVTLLQRSVAVDIDRCCVSISSVRRNTPGTMQPEQVSWSGVRR